MPPGDQAKVDRYLSLTAQAVGGPRRVPGEEAASPAAEAEVLRLSAMSAELAEHPRRPSNAESDAAKIGRYLDTTAVKLKLS